MKGEERKRPRRVGGRALLTSSSICSMSPSLSLWSFFPSFHLLPIISKQAPAAYQRPAPNLKKKAIQT